MQEVIARVAETAQPNIFQRLIRLVLLPIPLRKQIGSILKKRHFLAFFPFVIAFTRENLLLKINRQTLEGVL